MAKKKSAAVDPEVVREVVREAGPSVGIDALAAALVQAINQTKPVEKKNAINRKPGDPWQPKDGSKKIKMKRKFYQHGMLVDPEKSTNDRIELMNTVRPGVYMNGHVRVTRRRDRGIDISYPIKTASQRLKLINLFGIRNFDELLQRCITEAANPSEYVQPDAYED